MQESAICCPCCNRRFSLVTQEVVVRNFDMPFSRMVRFMVKWTLAAIPAMLIVYAVVLALAFAAYFLLDGAVRVLGKH